MLKLIACVAFSVALHFQVQSQFDQLVIEKIYSAELGNTYRVYAQLISEGDRVFAVYGDSANPLSIQSTQPFYQNRYGGGLASAVKRNLLEQSDSLKYDSWITIGAYDNYNNNLKTLGIELTNFERSGNSIYTADGALYCLPVDEQSLCNERKQVLLMQLTSKGVVSGTISIMGRNKEGENFQVEGISFSTDGL